ncbi:biogenesis of lysosome-related organelles complex 1 subunit 6-like isoform X2 [Metopolophium dirhodum]|uniref:biogenesis of lysosome-related organelles complex 1 subunit 6-like isoform X2 n=1 Tax=Metopolophium dirhodum TaxID=44670 RepID=UPI00298F7AE1|nr:biogenesis of lysosome-related organelles complex 1 subunit 6-like isoform X2 [Metopolophium dirhodum]
MVLVCCIPTRGVYKLYSPATPVFYLAIIHNKNGKQKSLIDAMLKENEELSNLLNESEVQNMFSSIKHCHGQLVELKKKLMFLHKKTLTLEKRANVLRVAKQREALQREHQKESMLVREQELISKQS